MSGSDRSDAEGLAPVTDLFGARSRRPASDVVSDGSVDDHVRPSDGAVRPAGGATHPAGRATHPAGGATRDAADSGWLPPVTGSGPGSRGIPARPGADVEDAPTDRTARPLAAGRTPEDTGGAAEAEPIGSATSGRASVSSTLDTARRASVFSIADGTAIGGPSAAGARTGTRAGRDGDLADDDAEPVRSREDQLAEAERTSMRTLGRRGVSTQELRTALRRHELDEDVVEHEVDRLTRVGLLDDAQLAADLADRLQDRKGLGHQGVVAELRRRGIDASVIEGVLAEREDDDDAAETERATDLAVKRAGQMRGLDRETAERRLSGFLMRKGYNGSVARAAVRTALDGRPGPRGGVRFE